MFAYLRRQKLRHISQLNALLRVLVQATLGSGNEAQQFT
jgi:hypothetical protein